jgi:hypothetical protein
MDFLAALAMTADVFPCCGKHTSDTIDDGLVVRGGMTLELDDGQRVHLRQDDCIVQNGTRHRWRNPLPEPCLMAFVSVGGKRR